MDEEFCSTYAYACAELHQICAEKYSDNDMSSTFAVFLCLLSAVAWTRGLEQFQPGPPDFCLEGPFHKDVPSPEEEDFHECPSWQDNACCNLDLSISISRHKAFGLYNYSWDLCGTLSPQCEEYIKVSCLLPL